MPSATKRQPVHIKFPDGAVYKIGFQSSLGGVGYYAKTHRGVRYTFGRTAEECRREFLTGWPVIIGRGVDPRADTRWSVEQVLNAFLEHKERERDSGDIRADTFKSLVITCRRAAGIIGRKRYVDDLRPKDFAELKQELSHSKDGAVATLETLARRIRQVRTMFAHASRNRHIVSTTAQLYGDEFKLPSARARAEAREERGDSYFTPEQLRRMVELADGETLAIVLLMINAAVGREDISHLQWKHVDLQHACFRQPRRKTASHRAIPLWPETIEALESIRPEVPDPNGYILQSKQADRVIPTTITKRVMRLIHALPGDTDGLTPYRIRHTVAGVLADAEAGDAVRVIMGHASSTMTDHYIHGQVGLDKLQRAIDHLHAWLHGKVAFNPYRGV